jgi:ABC-type dipeptide/oligopeptide/nickel transport system permease component
MGLRTYIAKRLAYSILLIILAMTVSFYIFQIMPGNVVQAFLPEKGLSYPEYLKEVSIFEASWGLNQPLYLRYFVYLKNMFTWNFGTSIVTRSPVSKEIMIRLPWTVLLIGLSTIISILVGLLTGVLAAYRRGTSADTGLLGSALVLGSLPTFWLGLVFIIIFCNTLHWFPPSQIYPSNWGVGSTPFPVAYTVSGGNILVNASGALTLIGGILSHAFLPVLTLSVFLYGGYTLLARATMVDALTEDYIVTARAKGVGETTVLFKHALKNASLPIITAVALAFGGLFSGATITETVFSWNGLGLWIYSSVLQKDFFAMQAIFFIITLCVIIANIIADLTYGIIDPRIKYG